MRLGDYEIQGELGRGAMGVVYRARHGPTGAVRAVKVLSGQVDAELLARFRREAEALARVSGGGVVPVHETGVERGHFYVVLGLMPGGSLDARLKARGRFEWREAAALVASLARALDRCHVAGIVHRDVKPANVLFDDEDRPCLADFGLARDLGAASLTATGTVLGSPAFMPPEQLAGDKVGPAADVYALGVTLHFLVTGQVPFASRSPYDLLTEKRETRPPRASAVAGTTVLDAPIARALAPHPRERTASAALLAGELEALLAEDAAQVPGAGEGAKRDAGAPRDLALRVLLVAAVVVVVVTALVFARVRGAPPPAAPSAPPADVAIRSARAQRLADARARLAADAPVTSADVPVELLLDPSPEAGAVLELAVRHAVLYARADAERLRAARGDELFGSALVALAKLDGTIAERRSAERVLDEAKGLDLDHQIAALANAADRLVSDARSGGPETVCSGPLVGAQWIATASRAPAAAESALAPLTAALEDGTGAFELSPPPQAAGRVARALDLAHARPVLPPRFARAWTAFETVVDPDGCSPEPALAALEALADRVSDPRLKGFVLARAVHERERLWEEDGVLDLARLDADERTASECFDVLPPQTDGNRPEGVLPTQFAMREAIAWIHAMEGGPGRAESLGFGLDKAATGFHVWDPASRDLLRFALEADVATENLDAASREVENQVGFLASRYGRNFGVRIAEERRREDLAHPERPPEVDAAIEKFQDAPFIHSVRALVLADRGRIDEAGAELALVPDGKKERPPLSCLAREAVARYVAEKAKKR